MNSNHYTNVRGITLVEVIVAMVVLTIASLGALSYQYHAAVQAKVGNSQVTATRTAQLLLEDWKSTGGSTQYKPSTLELGFEQQNDLSYGYFITVDGLPMYINLAHKDVAYDDSAGITLREISVTTRWRKDYKEGRIATDDTSLVLSTYVRLDAAGG